MRRELLNSSSIVQTLTRATCNVQSHNTVCYVEGTQLVRGGRAIEGSEDGVDDLRPVYLCRRAYLGDGIYLLFVISIPCMCHGTGMRKTCPRLGDTWGLQLQQRGQQVVQILEVAHDTPVLCLNLRASLTVILLNAISN